MASKQRETENFVWDSNAVLGKGATAKVYSGYDKRNGESVAIKCFTPLMLETNSIIAKQKREFDVFKKLNHENVVKLIAIEKEESKNKDVIVMELCNGPSLSSILKMPEYQNGFGDKEFLIILKHLTSAVKHLRDNNISHRDLKPGNIMKHINESGEVIYKLTDFGLALEAEDGEEFATLCGTVPFMHPNIFANNLFGDEKNAPYNSNVDLWSLGVTLYNVATGTLPFQPISFKDHKLVYTFLANKPSGSISGIEKSDTSEIEWGYQLPNSCALSLSLQKLLVPLFVGLFETDSSKVWSFERYFEYIDYLLSHKAYYLYYVNSIQVVIHYLSTKATFEDLKAKIEIDTNTEKWKQLFLYNGNEVTDLECIFSMEKCPLFVMDSQSKKINTNNVENLKLDLSFDIQQITGDWTKLVSIVQKLSEKALDINQRYVECVSQTKAKSKIVENIQKLIDSKVESAEQELHYCKYIFEMSKQLFDNIMDINSLVLNLKDENSESTQEYNSDYQNATINYNKLLKRWSKIEKAINKFNKMAIELKQSQPLFIDWQKLKNLQTVFHSNYQQINEYCSRLLLLSMSSNDFNLINFEKMKLESGYRKMVSIFNDKYLPIELEFSKKLEDWFPNAICTIEFAKRISNKINSFKRCVVQLKCNISKVSKHQKFILSDSKNEETQKAKENSKKSKIKQDLNNCISSHERLSALVQESQKLINNFNNISF